MTSWSAEKMTALADDLRERLGLAPHENPLPVVRDNRIVAWWTRSLGWLREGERW